MARRDVDLVIKAKDQAASVVDSITKALNKFVDAQKNLDTRADKTQTTLTALGGAIGKLDAALKGMDAGQKLAAELKKSTDALGRLESKFKGTQQEVNRLDKQLSQSKATLESYTGKLERNLAAQQKQKTVIAKAKVDQQELTKSYEKAVRAQEKLQVRQQQLPGLIEKASVAANKASTYFDKLSTKVAGTAKPTDTLVARLASAEKTMAKTGDRLNKLQTEFGQIDANLLAAGTAMTRFGEQANRAGINLTKQQGILANMAKNYERIKNQSDAVRQRQTQLSTSLNRATASLGHLQGELEQSRVGLERMAASSKQAEASLSTLAKRGFLSLVAAARDQKRVMLETSQAYAKARSESTQLGAALAKTANPTREMVQSFERASAETTRLKAQLMEQRLALQAMSQTLQRSGRDYTSLRAAQQRFLDIIDRQVAGLKRADAAASTSSASVRALAASSAAGATSTERAARAQARLSAANERGAAATGRMATAYQRFYGDTRRSLSLLQRIRGEVLSLVAAYGGLYGIITALKETVSATQTLEAAQARLNVAFNNNDTRVAAEFDFIRRTSDRLGVSLGGLATEYSKFMIATKNTALEGAKARKIFVQISEAARVNRSTTEELQGVFVALTQIVSKGAVQMEELRQQLGDRLPGAIKIMADGLGVTTAELVKMMQQGKITEEALVSFADEMQKRFGSGLPEALLGITVALGRLQNAAFQAAAAFGAEGFIDALKRFANTLTSVLKSADFEQFSRSASHALAGLVDFLGFLAKNFRVVIALITGLIAYKLTPIVIALGTAFTGVTRAVTVTGTSFVALQTRAAAMGVTITRTGFAIRALGRSMRALVGSTGIGLAFVAISTALSLWSTEADSATEALNRHRKIVDEVRNAYDKAGGAAKNWADEIKTVTLQQAIQSLKNLETELARARRDAILYPLAIENMFKKTIGGTEESRAAIKKWAEEFRNGAITATEMKRRLEQLAKQDKTLKLDFIVKFQDNLDSVVEFEKAVDEARLVVKGLGDDGEVAQKAMDGLNGALDPKNADVMKESLSKLGKAMTALEGMLPKAKTDTEDVAAAVQDMADAYQEALRQARSLPETIQRIAAEQKILNEYAGKYGTLLKGALDNYVSNNLVDKIIGAENATGKLDAKNPNSSATGLGQFISSTWLRMFKQYFPDRAASMTDAAILALRKDAAVSRNMVLLYIRENAKVYQQLGVQLTDANLYLAHFLGPQNAAKLIKSAPGTMAGDVLPQSFIDANKKVLDGKTREQVIAWAQNLVGYDKQQGAIIDAMTAALVKQTEERTKQSEQTAKTIGDNNFAIEQQKKIIDGKAREAAIDKAIRAAKEQNPNITDAEIAKIKEQAGALYDLAEARKKAEKAANESDSARRKRIEGEVNALLTQQKALLQQIKVARDAGNFEKETQLKDELKNVNDQLLAAIASAQEMWKAVGGPEANAAIARLDAAAAKTAALTVKTDKYRVKWEQVADMIVNGLGDAFDQFAQDVANGENAIQSLGKAFLKFASDFLIQIGRMIVQQAIFNALQGAFGGTRFGTMIGLGHTGGIVGSSLVGSGNATRTVNPAIFAAAMRYHTGGIVGLQPNEVPIIAKKGEEILTKGDPRHSMNGGLGGSGGSGDAPWKIVNAFDGPSLLDHALSTPEGDRLFINYVRANKDKIKAVLR